MTRTTYPFASPKNLFSDLVNFFNRSQSQILREITEDGTEYLTLFLQLPITRDIRHMPMLRPLADLIMPPTNLNRLFDCTKLPVMLVASELKFPVALEVFENDPTNFLGLSKSHRQTV
jgi:hypothetical protein